MNFIIKDADEVLCDIVTATVLTKPVQLWNLILKHLAQFTNEWHLHQLPAVVMWSMISIALVKVDSVKSPMLRVMLISHASVHHADWCGFQCVDSSKSPHVSGVFCQNTGKAKKQRWKNGNNVKIQVHIFVSASFIYHHLFRNLLPEHQSHFCSLILYNYFVTKKT